jgi:flagellar motor protein MotB
MILTLFAFALIPMAIVCGIVPGSMAVVQPTSLNSSMELRPDRSQKPSAPTPRAYQVDNRIPPNRPSLPTPKEQELNASRDRGDSDSHSSQDELSMTRIALQQAKQKIDELERQLAAGTLENAKRRIGELVIQLHAKDSEIAALRTNAYENSKKLREDLASQIEELNQAKRRAADIEQQLAAGKGQESTQAKRRVAEADLQIARKEQELAQAIRRVTEVEQQTAGREQELAQLKRRVAETEQQMVKKEQELAQAKRRVAEVELQAAGKEQELTQAKRRAADIEQQLAAGKGQESTQAKRRVAEADLQIARKEQELAQTKRRLAEIEQQAAGKEQELAQAIRRVTEVEQQTAGREQELAQLKRRVAETEQQAAKKELELAQAKRRVAEAEQQMAAGKGQELIMAMRRLSEAEQQTARKEHELAQVKDDLKQVTQRLADLNPQLMARDAELARTKQLLADLERNSSKQAEPAPAQEESPPSLPLPSLDQNLSVTNLISPSPAATEEAEPLFSSDLGKISESLTNLLQPELRKGIATLRQRGNKLILAFSSGELFPTGDATVTLGGASLLERVGAILHGFRYQSVEVAGHTDNMPIRNDPRKGFRDNIELSRARAEHAIQVLVNGGVEVERAKAVGYADTKPIAANDTEKGRSRNRRMEIVITQWAEPGGNSGDTKTQVGKKLQGFSTQPVTHH